MGILILGIKFYILLLVLNNDDRLLLVVDILLVRFIDGKNVVCVVLILVLVVINVCLVFIIFGCCNKICDDNFVGNLMFCRLLLFIVCVCGSLL